MSFLKVLLTVAIIAFGSMIFVLTSTSIPLSFAATMLNKIDGVSISGVKGSFQSGFSIESAFIQGSDKTKKLEIENMSFDYSLIPKEINGRKVFHIKNINISKLIVIGGKTKESEKDEIKENRDSIKAKSNKHSDGEDIGLQIDLVNVNNVVLKSDPNVEGFDLKQFVLKKFYMGPEGIEFNSLAVNSNALSLTGVAKNDVISLEGILHPSISENLTNDLSLSSQIILKKDQLFLSITLGKQETVVEFNVGNRHTITFNEMDLKKYFKSNSHDSISVINGKFDILVDNENKILSLSATSPVKFFANHLWYQLEDQEIIFQKNNESTIELHFSGKNDFETKSFLYQFDVKDFSLRPLPLPD